MARPTLRLFPYLSPFRRRAADFLTAYSALLIGVLFLLAGWGVIDDYGIGMDTPVHYKTAKYTLDYALGKDDALLTDWDRFYGVAFEVPLLLVERALGLADTRSIHLTRHFLIHLFFVAAGWCCYRLTWNLFHSRGLAILAMLLFLLHPRLYAHSFFNAKDLPLLSMFMIALYLLERALRRDTMGAFILGGVAVGLLTNIRIVGVMLFPAALAMGGLDLGLARDGRRRQYILLTAGVFALTAILTLYATWPWLWGDPAGRFLAAWEQMSRFPFPLPFRFQGETILATAAPPEYIPVWFAITAPPFILLLGLVGVAAVLGRGVTRPGAIFRNTRLRFAGLLLAAFGLPILAVMLLDSTLYNGWRQLFFLYAPFCLLAVLGGRWLVTALPGRGWQAGVYGLAGIGIVLTVLQMAQLHPHQQVYFNFLVNRADPDYLQTQYDLDYWRVSSRQTLEYLLERQPGERIYLVGAKQTATAAEILPAADRRRLVFNSREHDPDYQLGDAGQAGDINTIYAHRLYNKGGNSLTVQALDTARMDAAAADYYRQAYQRAVAGVPIGRGEYDLYRDGETLTFVRENCPPGYLAGRFRAKLYPPLPPQQGGQLLNSDSVRRRETRGVRMGDKCLAIIPGPDYPIAHILAGQYHPAAGGRPAALIWEELYDLARPGLAARIDALRERQPQPAVDAYFDLYRQDQTLIYYREPCAPAELQERFFLHITPAERRPGSSGFENRDFDFGERGGYFDGRCLAVVALPDYPIATIMTGQFTAGEKQLWAAELTGGR